MGAFDMDRLSMKFAFGGAFGKDKKEFDEVREKYLTSCADAAAWLRETPVTDEGHGWIALPDMDVSPAKEAGEWLRGFDSIIHVGIGGSALGSLMLNQAMFGDYFNEEERKPKFYLADNPDPSKTRAIWERVKNGSVALVGVSKSGSTAETMTQFMWFRSQLIKRGDDASKCIMVITDPAQGIFRAFADATGCRALDLPPSVGGRYSVLCNAGLAGAYAMGIDIDSLLAGAAQMRGELMQKTGFDENPAWLLAALNCFHETQGRHMSVLMPYSSRMAYFAEWYAQLWGESLGKEGRSMTPVRALGAIDQHSQVQLYTQGPDDKLFTILNVRDHGDKVVIPPVDCEALSPLAYLNGGETGHMLGLEAMSTASAIVKAGHPLVWAEIEKLDEKTLGALVFFYEYMTAVTGRVMGINPFDQPGVEQGKRYTYGLMGRDGYAKDADDADGWFGRIERHTIEL